MSDSKKGNSIGFLPHFLGNQGKTPIDRFLAVCLDSFLLPLAIRLYLFYQRTQMAREPASRNTTTTRGVKIFDGGKLKKLVEGFTKFGLKRQYVDQVFLTLRNFVLQVNRIDLRNINGQSSNHQPATVAAVNAAAARKNKKLETTKKKTGTALKSATIYSHGSSSSSRTVTSKNHSTTSNNHQEEREEEEEIPSERNGRC